MKKYIGLWALLLLLPLSSVHATPWGSEESYEEAAYLLTHAQIKMFVLELNLRMNENLRDCVCSTYPQLATQEQCRGREAREARIAAISRSANLTYRSEMCQSFIERVITRPLGRKFPDMRQALALRAPESAPSINHQHIDADNDYVMTTNIEHQVGQGFSFGRQPIADLAPLSPTEQQFHRQIHARNMRMLCLRYTQREIGSNTITIMGERLTHQALCDRYILPAQLPRAGDDATQLRTWRFGFARYANNARTSESDNLWSQSHWHNAYETIINDFPPILFFGFPNPNPAQILQAVESVVDNARDLRDRYKRIYERPTDATHILGAGGFRAVTPQRLRGLFETENVYRFRDIYNSLYALVGDIHFGGSFTDPFFNRDFPQLVSSGDVIKQRIGQELANRDLANDIAATIFSIGVTVPCLALTRGLAGPICLLSVSAVSSLAFVAGSLQDYNQQLSTMLSAVRDSYRMTDISGLREAEQAVVWNIALAVLSFGVDVRQAGQMLRALPRRP